MMQSDVYRQVAELHAGSINQGFLSSLGTRFLALMYQAIDAAEGSVLLIDQRDGRVWGFVSGAVGMRPIYRRMLRRPIPLGIALLPSLVRPSRLKRIVDILRYGGQGDGAEWPKAELLSIAVHPESRGTGAAEGLFRDLASYFRNAGESRFRIVVGDGLGPAHRFYRRMGCEVIGKLEVHPGEPSTVYACATTDA